MSDRPPDVPTRPSGRARRLLVAGGAVAIAVGIAAAGANLHSSARLDTVVGPRGRSAPIRVIDLGALPPEIRESSGLAVSRAHPGIFWTQNDSGDRPRLYAIDTTAALVATFEVQNALAVDWEALDIGPCPPGTSTSPWCLYVGDTGDNARAREWVTIYAVPEPDPTGGSGVTEAVARVWFRYEQGAFDAEALAVTPAGDVVIVTKGRAASIWAFTITAEEMAAHADDATEGLVLTAPIRLPIEPEVRLGRWVTGGSIDATGSLLALRTYTEVYFYRWPLQPGIEVAAETCLLGLIEPNGEAIAFSADRRLYLTSESPGGSRGHLLQIECSGL